MKAVTRKLLFTLIATFALGLTAFAQDIGFQRGRYKNMLSMIVSDIKKNYYDPTFRGVDLEAKKAQAEEKMRSATSISQLNAIIAQFLIDFDDSHLFYSPPGRVNKVNYGIEVRMIGDKPFIIDVEKDSDAAAKGIKVGDEIYAFDGFAVKRDNHWKIRYAYNALRPKAKIRLDVIRPDRTTAALEIAAKITEGKVVTDLTDYTGYMDWAVESESRYREKNKHLYVETGDVFIWKMPAFDMTPGQAAEVLAKAKKRSSTFILDLRGNGGGRVDMLTTVIGGVFPHDVKIGDEKTRKGSKELVAKGSGKASYAGKVIVLVDSGSGSSSEIFSRIMQLEKRGTVLGDRTAGAVMESRFFGHQEGQEIVVLFGASVTVADLIMKDGKSLEKIGVTPDEVILPTAAELAGAADPVLARALAMTGKEISSGDAGKIFPRPN